MYSKSARCLVLLILASLVAFGQSPSANTGFDVVAIGVIAMEKEGNETSSTITRVQGTLRRSTQPDRRSTSVSCASNPYHATVE
jgi:hypothetical protein